MSRRIVVPPVAALLLVAAYLVAESFGFRGFAPTEATTASEAAAMGYAARTLQLIADGQDPNQPQHVAAGVLDAGEYEMRPLEAAILGRHEELVRLLQRSGAARFDLARAICFARARLPEVLPDLGAPHAASADAPGDINLAISTCMHAR